MERVQCDIIISHHIAVYEIKILDNNDCCQKVIWKVDSGFSTHNQSVINATNQSIGKIYVILKRIYNPSNKIIDLLKKKIHSPDTMHPRRHFPDNSFSML